MRGADGGPWRMLCALPALWVGLIYDDEAQRQVGLGVVAQWMLLTRGTGMSVKESWHDACTRVGSVASQSRRRVRSRHHKVRRQVGLGLVSAAGSVGTEGC